MVASSITDFSTPVKSHFATSIQPMRRTTTSCLAKNVDAGLKLFERKAKSVDTAEHGTTAIETYVDLLDRLGRRNRGDRDIYLTCAFRHSRAANRADAA